MMGFQPPLSAIIRSLIYFLNYDKYEYEQLLDERMIVYSYLAIDPSTVPADFIGSESCQVLLSRFLYVDNLSDNYRYEPDFTREQMNSYVYRRWAHEGTYYGFTSYSNVTLALGVYDRGEHVSQEGFLIHRMFDTRYYLMAIVALFYRASLLDFAQKTALVSRRLYRDQEGGAISATMSRSPTRCAPSSFIFPTTGTSRNWRTRTRRSNTLNCSAVPTASGLCAPRSSRKSKN
jgi:hypothetical protein